MAQEISENKILPKTQGIGNNCKRSKGFVIHLSLLFLGICMSASGLVIQICYHLRHASNEFIVLFWNRMTWNAIHVWTSTAFSLIAIYHIWRHRKWYANAFKRISSRNRATVILTFLMFFTTIAGYLPLLIRFFDRDSSFRFSIIEFHDKIALAFFIMMLFHTLRIMKINKLIHLSRH